jgi:transcriptional regulator with XRE-family HTH domain
LTYLAKLKYLGSHDTSMAAETLGEILRRRREELGLTLREVEHKTGVSNAYLSQVENNKITRPSPSFLRDLAIAYRLSYARLMQLAGHPVVTGRGSDAVLFRTSRRLEELTEEEEEALFEYLRFLRMRRLKK